MKRIFIITIAILAIILTGSTVKAVDVVVKAPHVKVRVQSPATCCPKPIIVHPQVVVPAPIIVRPQVVVPAPVIVRPQVVVPPKPIFKTPIRDSLYYSLYYSRLQRYNRLDYLLGYPQQQKVE